MAETSNIATQHIKSSLVFPSPAGAEGGFRVFPIYLQRPFLFVLFCFGPGFPLRGGKGFFLLPSPVAKDVRAKQRECLPICSLRLCFLMPVESHTGKQMQGVSGAQQQKAFVSDMTRESFRVVHDFNSLAQETGAGRYLRIKVKSGLHNKFQTSQGYGETPERDFLRSPRL